MTHFPCERCESPIDEQAFIQNAGLCDICVKHLHENLVVVTEHAIWKINRAIRRALRVVEKVMYENSHTTITYHLLAEVAQKELLKGFSRDQSEWQKLPSNGDIARDVREFCDKQKK